MKIIVSHISPDPEVLSGITVYTWRIVEAIASRREHSILLRTNSARRLIPSSFNTLGIQIVHTTNFRNETLALFYEAICLLRFTKAFEPDIIFSPQPYIPPCAESACVNVVHDLYRATHPRLHRLAQRIQWRLLFPLSAHRADATICVSNATRNVLLQHYPYTKAKAIVVHEASPLAARAPLLSSTRGKYALVVANLTPTKNVSLLLDALVQLSEIGRKIAVVIVGRDNEGQVRRFLATNPAIDVHTIESVKEAELVSLYEHARCYVNISITEGFCLPILEAHTFGIPVVCSDLPVLREVAGNAALFIDPTDSRSLASSLIRIFDDETLFASLSERARANAKRFSWERAAVETLDVFTRAARQRHA